MVKPDEMIHPEMHVGQASLPCECFPLTTETKEKQKEKRLFFVRPIAPHTVFSSRERERAITFISFEQHIQKATSSTVLRGITNKTNNKKRREEEKEKKILRENMRGEFLCGTRK
jgi:hypothetical protein